MAGEGEPMIGFLRGDELQNLFGKVPKGQKTEKHDAEQRRRLLARKAKKKTMPPTRENEAPSEAGPANEPWQEQHWSERLPQSPEKGAPGEWEEQWDDSAQATYWYNRKTGEASWVDPTQQHLLGTPER